MPAHRDNQPLPPPNFEREPSLLPILLLVLLVAIGYGAFVLNYSLVPFKKTFQTLAREGYVFYGLRGNLAKGIYFSKLIISSNQGTVELVDGRIKISSLKALYLDKQLRISDLRANSGTLFLNSLAQTPQLGELIPTNTEFDVRIKNFYVLSPMVQIQSLGLTHQFDQVEMFNARIYRGRIDISDLSFLSSKSDVIFQDIVYQSADSQLAANMRGVLRQGATPNLRIDLPYQAEVTMARGTLYRLILHAFGGAVKVEQTAPGLTRLRLHEFSLGSVWKLNTPISRVSGYIDYTNLAALNSTPPNFRGMLRFGFKDFRFGEKGWGEYVQYPHVYRLHLAGQRLTDFLEQKPVARLTTEPELRPAVAPWEIMARLYFNRTYSALGDAEKSQISNDFHYLVRPAPTAPKPVSSQPAISVGRMPAMRADGKPLRLPAKQVVPGR